MRARGDVALMAEFSALDEDLYQTLQLYGMDLDRHTGRNFSTREWRLMAVFLLAVFTPLVLLAAGFLLGVIWLRDEHARLTALREEITQKSATMQGLAHGRDADFKAR
jgi:hypothetical protein